MGDCVREATDIARQAKVVLAFEPEVSNVVDSARKARRLLDEIGSPQLKVTMAPANLFHAGELPRMKEILDEAFRWWAKTSCSVTPRISITTEKRVTYPQVTGCSTTTGI